VRSAYTLIEVLVLVVILGIAAALIVPNMRSTDVLRVQAAVRTVVSDITVAQSDAVAYQQGRAIVFYPADNRYVTVEVRGAQINPALDRLWETRFEGGEFGDSRLAAVDFMGGVTLIFDELGAPVTTPGGNNPAPTGSVVIEGSGQRFRVDVEGYTGRVTVTREPLPSPGT
jgi:type II secretory pathway pseudopilin PulG